MEIIISACKRQWEACLYIPAFHDRMEKIHNNPSGLLDIGLSCVEEANCGHIIHNRWRMKWRGGDERNSKHCVFDVSVWSTSWEPCLLPLHHPFLYLPPTNQVSRCEFLSLPLKGRGAWRMGISAISGNSNGTRGFNHEVNQNMTLKWHKICQLLSTWDRGRGLPQRPLSSPLQWGGRAMAERSGFRGT